MARKNIQNRLAVSQQAPDSPAATASPETDYAALSWRDLLRAASEAGILERGMGRDEILQALQA